MRRFPPSPLLAVPDVIAHPLTANVPITVLLYDGPLLCGFNVAMKGLLVYVAAENLGIFDRVLSVSIQLTFYD